MRSRAFIILLEMLKEIKASIEAEKMAVSDAVLINSNQMEKLLKYSPHTLQSLRNEGMIPCNKIIRRYYYPKNFFTPKFFDSILKVEDPSRRFDDK